MPPFLLVIRVNDPDQPLRLEVPADPGESLAAVLARVHVQHHLPGMPADWRFLLGDLALPVDTEVRELPEGTELVLVRTGTSGIGPQRVPDRLAPRAAPLPPIDLPGGLFSNRPPAPPAPALPAPAAPFPRAAAKHRAAAPAPAPATTLDDLAGGVGDDYQLSHEVTHGMASRGVAVPLAERRATVRYYSRMNPDRVFPLLVVLSAEQVEAVKKRAVKQAESAGFQVEEGSAVGVEPVLPGCACYPPRDTVRVAGGPVTATFHVVPHVLGTVPGARVVVRQNGAVLAEVPLDVRVAKQTAAVLLGLAGLLSPYLMMGLRAAQLDYDSQKAAGFAAYQRAGTWLLTTVSPGWIGVALLALAVGFFLWCRPKRRDVFWEVKVAS